MATKKQDNKKASGKSDHISKLGLSLGLGTAAAIAAGSYYLYGTKYGAKNRRKLRGWMLKMKGEVMDKLEGLNDIDQTRYYNAVDSVVSRYAKMKKVDTNELYSLAKDLKRHWKSIKTDVEQIRNEIERAKAKPASAKAKSGKKIRVEYK